MEKKEFSLYEKASILKSLCLVAASSFDGYAKVDVDISIECIKFCLEDLSKEEQGEIFRKDRFLEKFLRHFNEFEKLIK